MSSLNEIITNIKTKPVQEDAAAGSTGSGSIATFSMPLMATISRMTQDEANFPEVKKLVEPNDSKKKNKKKTIGLKEHFDSGLGAAGAPLNKGYDDADVMATLKRINIQSDKDLVKGVTFGLESDDNSIVRVTVPREQARDFERLVQNFLADNNSNASGEVAEFLFNLKNSFTFLEVRWPTIEQDEETEQQVSGDLPTDGAEADAATDGEPGDALDAEMVAEPPSEDSNITSVLQQVIDMMRADADARRADAKAREAEAKAREADALISQTIAHVKREEQLLDMEAAEKARRDEERETKKVAKLMQWQKQTSGGQPTTEEEQFGQHRSRLRPPAQYTPTRKLK